MAKYVANWAIQGFGKKDLVAGDPVEIADGDEDGAMLIAAGAVSPAAPKSKAAVAESAS